MNEKPFEDPIVDEIHAIRAEMLAECGGDLQKLVEQVQKRREESGRVARPAPPRTVPILGHTSGVGTAGMQSESPASDL